MTHTLDITHTERLARRAVDRARAAYDAAASALQEAQIQLSAVLDTVAALQPTVDGDGDLANRLGELTGGCWYADSDGMAWCGSPYQVAVYTVQPSEAQRVADLLGYIWRGPMRAEGPGDADVLIPGHLYVFGLDTTKSQRDDVPDTWDAHKHYLVEGTPVRKQDNQRAVEGLGPVFIAWN
jgi:hypothetical protein